MSLGRTSGSTAARSGGWVGFFLVFLIVWLAVPPDPARADAWIYYSEPERTYGWCAGGNRRTLDSCAEKWCRNNGTACRPAVACGSGAGAIARAQKPAQGIAMVCGARDTDAARALAFTLCMAANNAPCWTETAFDRRGSKLGAQKNGAFDMTFFAQTMLQMLRIPGAGGTDGAYGPKTGAAIGAFQTRLGMPVDGAVSGDLLAVLIDAIGGTTLLIGELDRAFKEEWTRGRPLRPGESFAHAVSPPPAKSFDETMQGLDEGRRLTRFARMIRARDLPCAIPARGAVLANEAWIVTCAERQYELARTATRGFSISYSTKDSQGADENPPPAGKDGEFDGFVRFLLPPILRSFDDDWFDEAKLKQAVDALRTRMGEANLTACRNSEKEFAVLASGEPPAQRLAELYETVATEVAIVREMPLETGETRNDVVAFAVQLNIDCAFLARYEKRPWAALFFSSIAAELFPYAGLYPSLILASDELGITDFARVKLYAERAKTSPQAKWAQAVLPLFDKPTAR